VEPDRLLSTSSEGLSAKTEIEAPFFVNYGSRTLLRARTWQGKFSLPVIFERTISALTVALLTANTIANYFRFLKKLISKNLLEKFFVGTKIVSLISLFVSHKWT